MFRPTEASPLQPYNLFPHSYLAYVPAAWLDAVQSFMKIRIPGHASLSDLSAVRVWCNFQAKWLIPCKSHASRGAEEAEAALQ